MSATGHCNCGKVTVEVKPGLPDAAVLCRALPLFARPSPHAVAHPPLPRRLYQLPQDEWERVSVCFGPTASPRRGLTADRALSRSFSSNLVVKKADLAIKGEEHLKQYRDTNTDSGRAIVRHFCGNCGS